MVGKYPKGFLFAGWHPLCMCYPTAIMLSKTEFSNYLNSGKIDSQKYIRKIPTNAQNYISENKKTIDGWKNKLYFIRDNFNRNITIEESVFGFKFVDEKGEISG